MANEGTGQPKVWTTALTANDSSAKEELGRIRKEYDATNGEKRYMYIKAGGTIANGTPCCNMGVSGSTVGASAPTTNAAGRMRVIGFGIGTITSAYYGWIQIAGHHTAVLKHVKYSTTQHMANMVYLCGKIRGRRSNYDGATSSNVLVVVGFVPYATKTSACTTVSGFIVGW